MLVDVESRDACQCELVFLELIRRIGDPLLRRLPFHLRAERFNFGRYFRRHPIGCVAIQFLRGCELRFRRFNPSSTGGHLNVRCPDGKYNDVARIPDIECGPLFGSLLRAVTFSQLFIEERLQ